MRGVTLSLAAEASVSSKTLPDEPLEFRTGKAAPCFPDSSNPSEDFRTVAFAVPPASLTVSRLDEYKPEDIEANLLGESIAGSTDVSA
jgi:hypothetical protein